MREGERSEGKDQSQACIDEAKSTNLGTWSTIPIRIAEYAVTVRSMVWGQACIDEQTE